MSRLIDADNLYQYKVVGTIDNLSGDFIPGYVIAMAPTIEAEPMRRGLWAWHEDWWHSSISEPPELLDAYWMCSVCGTNLLQYLKSHFPDIPTYTECSEEEPTLERCPNCGAKMG